MARRGRSSSARTTRNPGPIVAAARRARVGAPAGVVAEVVRKAESWQEEAWAYFDETPEVKFAVRWTGDAFAKLRLFVAWVDPNDPTAMPQPARDELGDPIESVDATILELAEAELSKLRAPIGGQSEILRILNMNLEVAGECYLIGRQEQRSLVMVRDVPTEVVVPESWEIRSTSEVSLADRVVEVKESPSSTPVKLPDGDVAIRIYQRHPRWSALPDSSVRGVMRECKTLDTLTKLVLAEANSKRAAGVLLIPNEVVLVQQEDPGDGPIDADADGETNLIMQAIADATAAAIEDPEDPAAVAPVLVRGPGEYLDKMRHMMLARQSDQTLDSRIEARVRRVARGLNVPVEVVEGHMATTFANAEQIDQDAFEDHLQPRCVMVVDALTSVYLQPNLVDMHGVDPAVVRSYVIWYDPSELIRQPDSEAAADQGVQNGAISWAAWRQARGFDDSDAPTDEELAKRIGLYRGIFTSEASMAMLRAGGFEAAPAPAEVAADTAAVEDVKSSTAPPPPEDAALAAAVGLVVRSLLAGAQPAVPTSGRLIRGAPALTGAGPRKRPVGRLLADIDRDLRTRLLVAANESMTRALERAGNRAKTKAAAELRAAMTAAGITPIGVIPFLGRAGLTVALRGAAVESMFDDAWDGLAEQFLDWGARAQSSALDLAERAVGGLSSAARADLSSRQAESLAEAWAWMRENMDATAAARIFDPNPAAAALGEIDEALRVPAGLVRQALARAGGARGLLTAGPDGMWLTLTEGGTRPAGGIATGQDIMSTLTDAGVGVEGYVWRYGAAPRRTFEPHAELDGYEFVDFDDPGLANNSSFPATDFYLPGDHSGCLCDFEPIILSIEAAA